MIQHTNKNVPCLCRFRLLWLVTGAQVLQDAVNHLDSLLLKICGFSEIDRYYKFKSARLPDFLPSHFPRLPLFILSDWVK
jgi:hypothetical protein